MECNVNFMIIEFQSMTIDVCTSNLCVFNIDEIL